MLYCLLIKLLKVRIKSVNIRAPLVWNELIDKINMPSNYRKPELDSDNKKSF